MKALITGTTQGIGKAILDCLKGKYDVYVVDRHPVEKGFTCDLSNLSEVKKLCQQLKFYDFDILINNAGGSYPIAFENLLPEDIDKRMNLNFVAPLLIMQAVLPYMKKQQYGRIINISSVTGKTPVPYLHIYSAAKSALNSATQSLAVYYANNNICINGICPGSVDTQSSVLGRSVISQLRGNLEAQYQTDIVNTNSLNRMIKPREIAQMVNYLLSEGGNCITGQLLNICGTMEMN